MVIHGFKSFARKTEIDFDKEINLFVGPNGSGKTNIADSLCFVLGRLSVKSMRAAKAKNLLFMGSKYIKPANEASVELIFDNSQRTFSIDTGEVHLKRIVRRNGQSIYKINEDTKTRSEVIETLAQAGIDPYGFNLVMQGQIQSIVKMHSEERRKIIEDVAGISIYEARKEKSLHELNKTEERLKEISTILRERTSYLKNLEKEKTQAEKYKDSELMVKRAKASILTKKMKEKEKELHEVISSIEEKDKVKENMKSKIAQFQQEIEKISQDINSINKHIQTSTGLEQETLHDNIANLKAELEGLRVRKEGYENRKAEIERRIAEMSKSIPGIEIEIDELRKKSPLMAKKASEIKKKKDELAQIEQERRKLLTIKSEINSLKEMIKDKERQIVRTNASSEALVARIEESSVGLQFESEKKCAEAIISFREKLAEKKKAMDDLLKKELENEKVVVVADSEINRLNKIKGQVEKIDVCPLCQSKITTDHIKHVYEEAEDKIKNEGESKNKSLFELEEIKKFKLEINKEVKELQDRISKADVEFVNHRNIIERKEQLKKLVNDEKYLKEEIVSIDDKRRKLEEKSLSTEDIEEKYHKKMSDIEEISSRTEEDIDTTLLYKEREIENIRNIVKRSKNDFEEMKKQIFEITNNFDEKTIRLDGLEEKETELQERFKKMFSQRDAFQKTMQEIALSLNEKQQETRQVEDQINFLKIGKAKLDAEHESFTFELSEYPQIEIIQGPIPFLEERLKKSQEALQSIGSINMRALEVYDEVKKEYDIVQDKVNILVKEKEDIMKIIEEIDHKKIRSFMKTFKSINELFSQNFSKLSSKGIAYLEVENLDDLFAGGINIMVKMAKGKYFDVTSLSGGEQTLVALSLLFAIQEHKPYHFYIFDEIDAALDKRNSERLSSLITQYMKSGQYIVITHNDAIITNSNVLYGVSMHEGVSKILSLKIDAAKKENFGNNNPAEKKEFLISEKEESPPSEEKDPSLSEEKTPDENPLEKAAEALVKDEVENNIKNNFPQNPSPQQVNIEGE